MPDVPPAGQPAVVTLPAEIDATNHSRVFDQLHAAFTSGAGVVVADLTGTTFCDSASFRILTRADREASGHGVQLRLAITPGGIVTRMLQLLDLDRQLNTYPGVGAAVAAQPTDGQPTDRQRTDRQ